eukprot:GCRY01003170.1.p1 GENE.GCRY01003170.1~~GCRY01003170.1.p1  ORF type:complete len:618 (-),score=193.06 GCRY01003170.1:278-2131(-)
MNVGMFSSLNKVKNVVMGLPSSTDHDAIQKTLEILQGSSKTDEKQNAMEELRNISVENPIGVGEMALPTVLHCLKYDMEEVDMISAAIEILINVLSAQTNDQDKEASGQYAGWFLKDMDNASLLLQQLDNNDFYIRYNCLQLLSLLLDLRQSRLQECVLNAPMGLPRLMDLLEEKRDALRNEALLLLTNLSRGHQEIQKLIVFSSAFERLLTIIETEGGCEGGVVVLDALHLLQNLLRHNPSTQDFFLESGGLSRIPQLLGISMININKERATNLRGVLGLVSILLQGNSAAKVKQAAGPTHMLSSLIVLALTTHGADNVRVLALHTLAQLTREHADNQQQFQAIDVDSLDPLLTALQHGHDPSILSGLRPLFGSSFRRLALLIARPGSPVVQASAARLFVALLLHNPSTQLQLVSTVTPSPNMEDGAETEDTMSEGRLLLRALRNGPLCEGETEQCYQAMLAAMVMSGIVADDNTCKEVLLKIPLDLPDPSSPPQYLLPSVLTALETVVHSAIPPPPTLLFGFLRLMVVWVSDFPQAVTALLSHPQTVSLLLELSLHSSSDVASPVAALAAMLLCVLAMTLPPSSPPSAQTHGFDKTTLKNLISQKFGMCFLLSYD